VSLGNGNRRLAGMRAADFGQGIAFGEYVRQSNAETLVVLQIESPEALSAPSPLSNSQTPRRDATNAPCQKDNDPSSPPR